MEFERRKRRSPYRRNRKQQGAWLSILLIGVILLFSLVNLIAPDRATSEAENRKLAQSPRLTWTTLTDGSFFGELDDYFADQFVGRDFWISLRLDFMRLMGQRESNGIVLCDDDYLMEKPAAPNQEAVSRNLAAIVSFAQSHPNLNTAVCIAPTAACVSGDKLPSNIPLRNQAADIAALKENLEGVGFVDVTETLRAHRNEEIYYRTDHHWTSLGAYYAFAEIADAFGIVPQEVYDSYTVSTSFEGTLASKSGCHDAQDTVQIYAPQTDYVVTYTSESLTTASLYRRDALKGKDHYAVFFGGNQGRIDVTTASGSGRTLLLIKDSYANCMVQFFVPYFDRIIMIDPRYYFDNVDGIVSTEGVTDVLFLYNVNTFHADTTLYGVLE